MIGRTLQALKNTQVSYRKQQPNVNFRNTSITRITPKFSSASPIKSHYSYFNGLFFSPPQVNDKTTVVKFTPPTNYIEDARKAEEKRVDKLWRDYLSTSSHFTLSFDAHKSNENGKTTFSLPLHLEKTKVWWLASFKEGVIRDITFSEENAKKFADEGVEHAALVFEPRTPISPKGGTFYVFINSPGGLWTFTYSTANIEEFLSDWEFSSEILTRLIVKRIQKGEPNKDQLPASTTTTQIVNEKIPDLTSLLNL